MDQELLQRTIFDGERHESLTTTKTLWKRNRGERSDNEPTPSGEIRALDEKQRKEDKKTSSVDYQLRARKSSDIKTSSNNIDRNTTNQKRGKHKSTSNSDSEGQEENEDILRPQRKRSNLEEKEESAMTRLQSNGADQISRSVTGEYEEDKTCRSLTGEEKISHTARSNDLDKHGRRHREYPEGDKDFISGSRHCLKEDKSHINSDSSDSDGEQEVKRSAHEGQGGVKLQDTPVSDTNRQQRSRSRSAGSSNEKNRKSRHHHHHHRHRRHHHRHHRNRSSTQSENRAEKHTNRDSTS